MTPKTTPKTTSKTTTTIDDDEKKAYRIMRNSALSLLQRIDDRIQAIQSQRTIALVRTKHGSRCSRKKNKKNKRIARRTALRFVRAIGVKKPGPP